MKFTLAIVLAILAWVGTKEILQAQAPQGQAQDPKTPPSSGGGVSPQQPGTSPPASLPCAQTKDTCEVEPAPQAPAKTPPAKPEESPATAAPSKNKRVHRHKTAKSRTASPSGSIPKTVVRNGGTYDPAAVLTPGVAAETKYSRQMTADLLSATDTNLKQATSRSLNTNEQQTVSQIRLFMEQANDALKVGDLDRGYNLALKAHLLSDDLVKH